VGARQNPDDFHCRPVRFQKIDSDGSIVQTFGIFTPWPKIMMVGELDIRQTLDGALHASIMVEEEWRSE
jgi:hypothetical protein